MGRASVLGTGGCAILYLLVSGAVIGLVPHHALVGNGAPFVDAFEAMFPRGPWGGKLIAAVAVVSGFGALIGWTLVDAELPSAVASDGLFPKPLGWSDRNGNAWFSVVINAVLPSLLMLRRYTSSSGLTVFTYMVNLTVVTVAIPYFFSACAQVTFLLSKRRRVRGWALARDLTVAGASVPFSMWVTLASGYQALYQSIVAVAVGVVLYAFLTARHAQTGQIPEPVDNPPDGSTPQLVPPPRPTQ